MAFVAVAVGETEDEALARHMEDRPIDAGACLIHFFTAADGDLAA